jgi:hypothetical protein
MIHIALMHKRMKINGLDRLLMVTEAAGKVNASSVVVLGQPIFWGGQTQRPSIKLP